MKCGFKERLLFFLTKRLISLALFRRFYYQMIGMQIGFGTIIPRIHVTWPHQVKIGSFCRIEHDVYFHFDGVYQPGPSIIIGKASFLGAGCEFNICKRIEIGDHCLIAAGSRFVDHDHDISGTGALPQNSGLCSPIVLGDYVWVGANAVILKSVQIGLGAVVAAGAVVTKSIPPNEIWGGVPAKKIGERKQIQV